MGQAVFSLTRTCASACHPEHTLPLTRPACSEGRSSGLVTMADMSVSGGSHRRYAGCLSNDVVEGLRLDAGAESRRACVSRC
jgi:hypothetical protein